MGEGGTANEAATPEVDLVEVADGRLVPEPVDEVRPEHISVSLGKDIPVSARTHPPCLLHHGDEFVAIEIPGFLPVLVYTITHLLRDWAVLLLTVELKVGVDLDRPFVKAGKRIVEMV